jgi:hypothetical protein
MMRPNHQNTGKLFCVAWRKIKFFCRLKDMAVDKAGQIAGGGGSAGVSGAGSGS